MLVLLPVLLACSAYFSGSETALFSLTRHQCHELSRAHSIATNAITRLIGARRDVLVTLLMGNMFVNVMYFVIGTVLILSLTKRGEIGAAVGNAINIAAVLLLILVGEVLPKLVASRYALSWSMVVAVPLLVVHRVLSPLRVVLRATVVDPFSRLLAPSGRPVELSPAELERLLELSQHQGVIDAHEEQTLQQVLSLGQMKVLDLMRPRVDIKAFNLADDAKNLIEMARQWPFSRFPVYRGDLDQIEGIVHARQVLLSKPQTAAQVQKLIQPVWFVPELQRADQLLIELRRRQSPMAVAVDEYGGTAGLVTLEDVVENMVGQIAHPDEPQEAPKVQSIGSHHWRVSAQLSIREWPNVFGPVTPIANVSTVGGLVMARLGRMPSVGDSTTLGNLSIEVETMKGRRIDALLLRLQDQPNALPGATGVAHQ